ncbi:cilia- and flagella-associated protein 251-like [Salarias fasciatus]|uniref:cilia- and flagella-associated protein 251-like n=1 Tax=Salarias fasciatus TaxID=181472 RepID=UPI00117706EF|nr:cilia- and flagella-associated protein 251-like [Salarias fasciatus]
MKVFLLLAVCVLSLHNGKGAPRTAVYKFVRCNPEDDDANCVTQQTQEMEWSPDLPGKLPASAAQNLEAEPVEDESPAWEQEEMKEEQEEYEDEPQVGEEKEEEEEEEEEEYDDWELEDDEEEEEKMEKPVLEEEGESPLILPSEESSGGYEGSAGEDLFVRDMPVEIGSGESWTEKELYKVGDVSPLRRLFPSRPLAGEAKPEERDLKQDHILPL